MKNIQAYHSTIHLYTNFYQYSYSYLHNSLKTIRLTYIDIALFIIGNQIIFLF